MRLKSSVLPQGGLEKNRPNKTPGVSIWQKRVLFETMSFLCLSIFRKYKKQACFRMTRLGYFEILWRGGATMERGVSNQGNFQCNGKLSL